MRLEEGDAEAEPDEPDHEIRGESGGPGNRVDRGIRLTRQIFGGRWKTSVWHTP